jgi:DNA adenine methylase
MKPPLSYYGGKQNMLCHILPLIPEHKAYTEAFAGGAALYFAKPPSEVEIINDTNGELVNFYWCLQNRFELLRAKVLATLHSRKQHGFAAHVYAHPQYFSRVRRAWAVWMLSMTGFSSRLDAVYGYGKKDNSVSKKVLNRKRLFTDEIRQRIELAQIECTDALRVISSRDTLDTFHYVDPPYFNSDCGHYGGYMQGDFERLLQLLGRVRGKFLLSSYDSDVLATAVAAHGWQQRRIEQTLAVDGRHMRKGRTKVEVLTANYELGS